MRVLKQDLRDFLIGDVIHLGRLNDVAWAPDRATLYTQSGSKVSLVDLDGNELESFSCIFNNACMHAPSPDGKRFAGIQKFVPTNQGNPVITISNHDFTEKESIFISENKALILSVTWLQDNRHLVVYGMTAKQRTRRFWRLDYLSVIDTETGEERRINLNVPDDAESFSPCGLSPDENYFVYLQAGGRVKQEGYILMSGRYALSFPLDSDDPEFNRMSILEDAWESCPVWLNESPAKQGSSY
jgi:Tol biopolymer transport system component